MVKLRMKCHQMFGRIRWCKCFYIILFVDFIIIMLIVTPQCIARRYVGSSMVMDVHFRHFDCIHRLIGVSNIIRWNVS